MTDEQGRAKVLVIGAGAVGGFFGGKLCRAGSADVVFAARGRTLAALERNGLAVESVDGDFALPDVRAAELAAIDERFDYVLVCVKHYHLDEALAHLQDVVGERTAVISLLNGLGAEERISTTVGNSRAFGGVAYVGAHVEEPGVVVHTGAGRIAVGALPRLADPADGAPPPALGSDERLQRLADLCREAGFDCDISANIVLEQWRKLVWNAAINAVTALGGSSIGEALAVSDGEKVIRAAMLEAVMVGQSAGIPLNPTDIDNYLAQARGSDVRTSMEFDASRGRRLEADAINGAIVSRARGVGIPVPVNQTLYSLLKILDARAAES